MKKDRSTQNAAARRHRRLMELQVREYNERYHPELADAAVEVSGDVIRVYLKTDYLAKDVN